VGAHLDKTSLCYCDWTKKEDSFYIQENRIKEGYLTDLHCVKKTRNSNKIIFMPPYEMRTIKKSGSYCLTI